jgi:hypothetical protein
MMSREAFDKWADEFNPMMAGFLKENLAFFETYEAGMQVRQPEIDELVNVLREVTIVANAYFSVGRPNQSHPIIRDASELLAKYPEVKS